MDIVQKLKNWKHWATGGQKIVLEETIAEIERLRNLLNSHAKMSEDKGQR